jgi:hypothetical protein
MRREHASANQRVLCGLERVILRSLHPEHTEV